jgi:hypothetical protein
MDTFTKKRLENFTQKISELPQSIGMHMTVLPAPHEPIINLSKEFYRYAVEAINNMQSGPNQNMDELVSNIKDIDDQIKSYIEKHILVSDEDDSGMLHSDLSEADDLPLNMIGENNKPNPEDFLDSVVPEHRSFKSAIAKLKI